MPGLADEQTFAAVELDLGAAVAAVAQLVLQLLDLHAVERHAVETPARHEEAAQALGWRRAAPKPAGPLGG
jgi:hypothetical protein